MIRPLATRLACAVEPLIGRHLETTLSSPRHGGAVVSLWIQPLNDGQIQVDAVLPIDGYRVLPIDGYRVLFKERHATAGPAIASWRVHYLALFGVAPLI